MLAATSAHLLPSPGRASKGLSRPRATASAAPSSRRGRCSRQPAASSQQSAPAPPRGPARLVHQLSPEGTGLARRPHPRLSRPLSLRARGLRAWAAGPPGAELRARGTASQEVGAGRRASPSRGPGTPGSRRAPNLPPRRQEKFFSPLCALPPPQPVPPWVGLGSLVKKVTRPHQLLLPPGTGWGWREAGAAADPGRPPAPPPPAEQASRGSAQRGAHGGGPPERVCAPAAAAVSNLLFLLPAAPRRARVEGRGSLSAKCCSLVLRGGCSSSNSHSFRRLT